MYQRRLKIWAITFAIYFALCGLYLIIPANTKLNIYIDADSIIKEKISEVSNLTDIKENAQVIISSDPELNEPGFEKVGGSIYSPVVCYCPGGFSESGYLYKSGTSTRYIN